MYIYAHTHMYVYMYMCVCVCVYVFVCVCVCVMHTYRKATESTSVRNPLQKKKSFTYITSILLPTDEISVYMFVQ